MADLLSLDNDFKVVINKPFIYTVEVFRKILERDRGGPGDKYGHHKLRAKKEFYFLYNYCDFTSPFIEYDEEDRFIEAALGAGYKEDEIDALQNDELIQQAIITYNSLKDTRSLKLVRSAMNVIDKLRIFYDDLDLKEETRSGVYKHKPKDILTSLKDLGPTLKKLQELESSIKKELQQAGRIRGGVDLGIEENPD